MIKNFNLSPHNLDNFIAKVKALDLSQGYVANVDKPEKNRTDLQNRLSHAWYKELSEKLKDNDALGWKCYCKLHFGVPIMRAEDDDFRKVYDLAIKAMSYENKLEVMKILPVTSLMKTKQLTKYLDEMKAWFETREGIILEYPINYELDDKYYK